MKKMFFYPVIVLSMLIWGPLASAQDNNLQKPYTGNEPDTLLLWHFDSPGELLDSGPSNHDLSLFGSASVAPGKFGDALTVLDSEGGASSSTGSQPFGPAGHPDPDSGIRVIEFWLKMDAAQFDGEGNFQLAGNQLLSFINLLRGNGGLGFDMTVGTNEATLWDSWGYPPTAQSDSLSWESETWYHLAYEHITDTGINFYRDGVQVGSSDAFHSRMTTPSGSLILGDYIGYKKWGLVGQMDEFRISDTAFNPVLLPVSIGETDDSTIVFESGSTTDSFTVVLIVEPNAPVTITVDPETDDVSLNAEAPNDAITLTFGTDDWDTPQAVTVKANDDDEPEGEEVATVGIILASDDPDFVGTTDVSVNVVDDDSAIVVIGESEGATAVVEGGATDSYTVVLGFAPTSEVTITIDDNGEPNQVTVNGSETTTLTFTTSNWNTAQTVTVEAIDDDVPETVPHHTSLTHSVSQPGGDNAYDGLSVSNVSVSVGENDCGVAPIDDTDFTGGPEGQPDCITDLLDFAHFVANYLNCSLTICP